LAAGFVPAVVEILTRRHPRVQYKLRTRFSIGCCANYVTAILILPLELQ
jgi:hypothetical protein